MSIFISFCYVIIQKKVLCNYFIHFWDIFCFLRSIFKYQIIDTSLNLILEFNLHINFKSKLYIAHIPQLFRNVFENPEQKIRIKFALIISIEVFIEEVSYSFGYLRIIRKFVLDYCNCPHHWQFLMNFIHIFLDLIFFT